MARNAANPGDLVKFTAKVYSSQTGIIPSGLIVFKNNNITIGVESLDNQGTASIQLILPPGDNLVTATYLGSDIFNPATSSSVIQVVLSPTILNNILVSLTSSSNIVSYGNKVSIKATLTTTGSMTIPSGNIQFYSDGNLLYTLPVLSNTVSTPPTLLQGGSHLLKAIYLGDNIYGNSVSSPISQLVTPLNTTTTLASSENPAYTWDNINITATVSASYGFPNGNVNFYDNGALVAVVALNNGRAVFTTSYPSIGNHSIYAQYVGNSNYNTSTSAAYNQSVLQSSNANTTTSLTSSLNPSSLGAPVQLTATVIAGFGIPDGLVNFYDGYNLVSTNALSSGSAQITIFPSAGVHVLSAQYLGSSLYNGSVSANLYQTVNAGNTSVNLSLVGGTNPSTYGNELIFSAVVSSPSGTSPTGNIYLYDGYTSLIDTKPVVGNSAIFNESSLISGTHYLTAVYSGDANLSSSTSNVLSETITNRNTNTAIVSSTGWNHIHSGNPILFTATVSSTYGIPTGNVAFFDGYSQIGTTQTIGALGQASITTSSLSVGNHTIYAVYYGDSNYNTSTSLSHTQLIDGYTVGINLTSSINPTVTDQQTTFTATLTGYSIAPTGTISFYNNGVLISTQSVSGGGASVATGFVAGSYTITAVYSGDTNYSPVTSGNLTQTVNKETVSISLGESPSPGCDSQNVAYTVSVASSLVTATTVPTGTVTLTATPVLGGSAITLGSGSLSSGSIVINSNSLTVGSYNTSVSYSGDSNFTSGSYSGSFTVNSPAATTTVVSASPSSIALGGNTTLNATVSYALGGAVTTGSVSFYYGSPTNLLGTVNLTIGGGGLASLSITGWSHGTGSILITAIYNPSGCIATSSGTTHLVVG